MPISFRRNGHSVLAEWAFRLRENALCFFPLGFCFSPLGFCVFLRCEFGNMYGIFRVLVALLIFFLREMLGLSKIRTIFAQTNNFIMSLMSIKKS
jgi:hypothetical protein